MNIFKKKLTELPGTLNKESKRLKKYKSRAAKLQKEDEYEKTIIQKLDKHNVIEIPEVIDRYTATAHFRKVLKVLKKPITKSNKVSNEQTIKAEKVNPLILTVEMKYEYFKHVSYEILNKYFNFLKTDLLFGESKNIPYATFIYKNRGILSDDLVITLNTIFTKNSISGMYLSHGIEVEVNNIERYVF